MRLFSSTPTVWRFRTLSGWLATAVVALGVAAVLLHVPLIFGGQWQGDEWAQFSRLRDFGAQWFFFRLVEWSPRPASEILLVVYYLAERAFHAALIEVFLGGLWIVLTASIAAAALRTPVYAAKWPIVASLGALFLLGHRLFAMFLWPMSAAAYVLALAGVAAFVVRVLFAGEPETPAQRAFCFAMLLLAATAAECGTFFVLICGSLILLSKLAPGDLRKSSAENYWYLVPLAVAVSVIGLGLIFRVSQPPAGAGGPYLLHFGRSLTAASKDLPLRLLVFGAATQDIQPAQALAMRLLTFVGCALLLSASPLPRAGTAFRALVAVSLIGAIFLISLSAYYAYGIPGTEAHQTFQDCLAGLSMVTLASLLTPLHGNLPGKQSLGLAALLGVVVIGLGPRLADIREDYSVISAIRQATTETWKSGTDKDPSEMTFVNPPSGHLLAAVPMEIGKFAISSGARWDTIAMLKFFGKSGVDVVTSQR